MLAKRPACVIKTLSICETGPPLGPKYRGYFCFPDQNFWNFSGLHTKSLPGVCVCVWTCMRRQCCFSHRELNCVINRRQSQGFVCALGDFYIMLGLIFKRYYKVNWRWKTQNRHLTYPKTFIPPSADFQKKNLIPRRSPIARPGDRSWPRLGYSGPRFYREFEYWLGLVQLEYGTVCIRSDPNYPFVP